MFPQCCICFVSFDVVCYEFDNGVWDVCRRFLVSLCMFTESKALFMSRATVIMREGGVF